MTAWKQTAIVLFVFALSACTPPADTPAAEGTAGETSTEATATGEANSAPTSTAPVAAKKAPAPKPSIKIPASTELQVVLSTSLSSEKNEAGDTFNGNLGAPVTVDGVTALPKGTMVHGKVVAAEGAGRVKGLASMRLTLTAVMLNDEMVPVTTKPFAVEAENTKKRDAGIIGGAAGVGAAIGAIAGGGKGAVTGAVIGGGAGTGTVLATKGKEVEFPAETKLRFTLDKELTVTP